MIILFEESSHKLLSPLVELRHSSELLIGTSSILQAVKNQAWDDVSAWGREYIGHVFKERTGIKYNEKSEGTSFLISATVLPRKDVIDKIKNLGKNEAILDGERLVAANVNTSSIRPGMISKKQIKHILSICKKRMLNNTLLKNYWDFVRENGETIREQFSLFGKSEKTEVSIKGSKEMVHLRSSLVDIYTLIDTTKGPVIIEEDVEIEPYSLISGPAFIGRKTRIYSALIRGGTSIFTNCRVAGEVGNTIIYSFSNKPHHGYVGDSIIGEWANLGAGATFSNLKNTYGNVRVTQGGRKVNTGMQKLGPLVSDMVKISINSSIYGGRKVGISSFILGTVDRDVGNFVLYKNGKTEIISLDKVIEVQERMMARRGERLSKKQKQVIEFVYKKVSSKA